jgi:hypothetical protein
VNELELKMVEEITVLYQKINTLDNIIKDLYNKLNNTKGIRPTNIIPELNLVSPNPITRTQPLKTKLLNATRPILHTSNLSP